MHLRPKGSIKFGIVTRYLGFNDGQGRVNYEIAQEAALQGYEVLIFSEQVDPRILMFGRVRTIILKPPQWLPSRLLRDQLFAVRSMIEVKRQKNNCDALLVNGFVTWHRCAVNAVHFVHSSWQASLSRPTESRMIPRDLYARLYVAVNVHLERWSLRRSDRVVAVSPSVCRELEQIGVPHSAIDVIINGVDTDEFRPGDGSRKAFGLSDAGTIALFAGDITTSRKNLDLVLRALQLTQGISLAVAGRLEGSPYPAIAKQMGLDDRVYFLGFQEDMPALMRSADFFLLPSRYEPFGLVVLEAMASGLPVLTTREAGIAPLINEDVGLVLDDADDAPALADWMQSLAKDPERRRRMGLRARKVAEAHSWRAMSKSYVDLLRSASTKSRSCLTA